MIFKEIIDDYKREHYTAGEWFVFGILIPLQILFIIAISILCFGQS